MIDAYLALVAMLSKIDGIKNAIYPDLLPSNATLPAIVYTDIGLEREQSRYQPSGAYSMTFQVTVWAAQRLTVEQIATQIMNSLDRQSGIFGGIAVDDVIVQDATAIKDPDTLMLGKAIDIEVFIVDPRTIY